MKSIISLLFLLLCYPSFSQNLVLNGSFEEFESCPKDYSGLNDNVENWSSPTESTPDLFSSCYKHSPFSVPNNFFGWQKAKDGNTYAGIIAFGEKDYREYLTGEFSENLIEGHKYKMNFYISLAETSGHNINSFGVYFSSKMSSFKTPNLLKNYDSSISVYRGYIDVEEEIRIDTLAHYKDLSIDSYYSNQNDWVEVEFVFIAKGSEQFFTIGNFQNNTKTKFKRTRKRINELYAYYYVDDVSIIALDKKAETLKPDEIMADNIAQESLSNEKIENISSKPIINEDKELNSTVYLPIIYFEFDSYRVKKDSWIWLDRCVEFLKHNPQFKFLIYGHTDNDGASIYNQSLSIKRAQAVKSYLVSNGVSEERLTISGYGETKPMNAQSNSIEKSMNRRVEFILSK